MIALLLSAIALSFIALIVGIVVNVVRYLCEDSAERSWRVREWRGYPPRSEL
jgi:hypothetical protein